MHVDAHEKPPEALRALYKRYHKTSSADLDHDPTVVDFARGLSDGQARSFEDSSFEQDHVLAGIFNDYLDHDEDAATHTQPPCSFACKTLPGLVIIPSLIPLTVQKSILHRTFHRDLSNAAHKTNVHFHHHLQYPEPGRSFFDHDPDSPNFIRPKDPCNHKPMSTRQFFNKKLRWITLGGQYDWTEKVYPDESPPPFPEELRTMLKRLFPQTEPQAAIVNVYSPGDVLSLHRDVSESCDNGLISASIGCDGLFIVALDGGSGLEHAVIRLRSGDVVYMSGPSRYAWHGVPLILRGTCPEELKSWPAIGCDAQRTTHWSGWMASKRINLNVRQMWD